MAPHGLVTWLLTCWLLRTCPLRVRAFGSDFGTTQPPVVINYTETHAFPLTCSDPWQCRDLHPFAVCRSVSLSTSGTGNVTSEYRCVCDQTESYFLEGDTCVLHAHVSDQCKEGRGRCVDRHSLCVDDGGGYGLTRCMCEEGTLKVRDGTGLLACARIILGSAVHACAECEKNEGTCYDINEDGEKDGCLCPASLSGPDCQHLHVHVQCSTDTLSVCYEPHSQYNFSRGSRLYVDGVGDRMQCQGIIGGAAADAAGCRPDEVYLALPLGESTRFTCATRKHKPDSSTVKFESMLVVEKGLDADGEEDDFLFFKVFCTYRTHAQAGFIGMKVDRPPMGEAGDAFAPQLTFSVETALGESIPAGVSVRAGDKIKYRLFLDTSSGYETMRVESCVFTSTYNVPHDPRLITSVVEHSCPAEGQTLFDPLNTWRRGSSRLYELETGPVTARPFPSGRALFLRCTVRVCLRNFEGLCDPVACHVRRKRRSGDALEVKLLEVTTGLSVWREEDFTLQQNQGVKGAGLVTVSQVTVAAAAALGVVLAAGLVVLITLLVRRRHGMGPDEDQQGLHQPGALDYGTERPVTAVTQTRV